MFAPYESLLFHPLIKSIVKGLVSKQYLFDVEELDLLRFSLELVALLLARLVDDDVGLRRLPVDAPKAREGVDRGAEDLVSAESEIQFIHHSYHTVAIHGIVEDASCIQL